MAVDCHVPHRHYGAYFTEVQDIEDHCVVDSQDDENAATDGLLFHLNVIIIQHREIEYVECFVMLSLSLFLLSSSSMRHHFRIPVMSVQKLKSASSNIHILKMYQL